MSDTFQFNGHEWVAVIPSELTDNFYVEQVPKILFFHHSQVEAVREALQKGSDFLMSVSSAMRDGWGRPSDYLAGVSDTGVWWSDNIPVGEKEWGDTHIGIIRGRFIVLFLVEVWDGKTRSLIPPQGFYDE